MPTYYDPYKYISNVCPYIYINKEVFSVIHFPDMGVTEHGLYPPNAAKFKANTMINQWMFG